MSRAKIIFFGFCLVCFLLAIWRYQAIELRIQNNVLKQYNDLDQEITLTGTVIKEPDVREKSIKLTTEVSQIEPLQKMSDRTFFATDYIGKVLLTTARYPGYKYGDELKITGKLQTPPIFEDFNYKDYLIKDGIYSVIYYPEVEIIARDRTSGVSSGVYAKILDFKDKLRQSIYQNLPTTQSYILGAMILGDKNKMPQELKEKLNISGVRHITAVSGLHIFLLTSILMSLMLWLGFWRSQAFYISIIIITLFIIITGLQPSSIRAGIMGGLFLLGQKIGRKSVGSRAVVIAAALMLVINPLLLFNDLGFQLSFLAAMGIIYLSSTFQRWLRFIPEKKFLNFRSILAMTFSAYLFTLPILVYSFGRASLAAPLTNVLILPAIYWIMISGFIFGLVGIIWQGLGWILSLPCWFLLTYLIKIVNFFSQPWADWQLKNVHWLWLIISYLILGFFVWHIRKRERLKFLKY